MRKIYCVTELAEEDDSLVNVVNFARSVDLSLANQIIISIKPHRNVREHSRWGPFDVLPFYI